MYNDVWGCAEILPELFLFLFIVLRDFSFKRVWALAFRVQIGTFVFRSLHRKYLKPADTT